MAFDDRAPALTPPAWVPPASVVICLLAVVDSAYLTYSHFTTGKVTGCVINSFIDCNLVTNSVYSHFLGLPVSVLGLAWSVGMLALCSPWAWRALSIWVARVRLLGSVTGVAMVLWLVYAELFKLGKICEFCTGVHFLTLVLFVVVSLGTALAVRRDDLEPADEEGPVPATG